MTVPSSGEQIFRRRIRWLLRYLGVLDAKALIWARELENVRLAADEAAWQARHEARR